MNPEPVARLAFAILVSVKCLSGHFDAAWGYPECNLHPGQQEENRSDLASNGTAD